MTHASADRRSEALEYILNELVTFEERATSAPSIPDQSASADQVRAAFWRTHRLTMERAMFAYAASLAPQEYIELMGIVDGFNGLVQMVASQDRVLPIKPYSDEYFAKVRALDWLEW